MDSSSHSHHDSSSVSDASLLQVIELVVRQRDFKNIDLFRQGLYHIRTAVYTGESVVNGRRVRVNRALPYTVTDTHTDALPSQSLNRNVSATLSATHNILYPSYIDIATNTYVSKSFRIQYAEQTIALNESCQYRLEVSARSPVTVLMDCELWFTEYTNTDYVSGIEPPTPEQFDRVSRVTYRVNHSANGGVSAFVPVTFDDQHFAVLSCMVHTMLIEYKFRLHPNHYVTSSGGDSAVRSPSLHSRSLSMSVNDITLTDDSSNDSTSNVSHSNINTEQLYPPFAVILFPRLKSLSNLTASATPAASMNNNSPSLSSRTLITPASLYSEDELSSLGDRYHTFFLVHLVRAYNQLAIIFEQTLRACVDDDRRADMESRGICIKPLTLPGEMVDGSEAVSSRSSSLRPPAIETQQSKSPDGSPNASPVSASPQLPSTASTAATTASIKSSTSSQALNNHQRQPSSSSARSRGRRSLRVSNDREESEFLAHMHKKYCMPRLLRLSERLKHRGLSYDTISRQLLTDIGTVASQCFHLWQVWIQSLPLLGSKLFALGHAQYHRQCVEHWSAFIFRESYSMEHRTKVSDDEMLASHGHVAMVARKNAAAMMPLLPIIEIDTVNCTATAANASTNSITGIDSDSEAASATPRERGGVMGEYEHQVVIFEQSYTANSAADADADTRNGHGTVDEEKSVSGSGCERRPMPDIDVDHATLVQPGPDSRAIPSTVVEAKVHHKETTSDNTVQSSAQSSKNGSDGKHLYILCHGYQGNSWDLRIFRNQLSLLMPDLVLVNSSANENLTEDDIGAMGARLANEILEVIQEQCHGKISALSFIAHSLGGVIVRQALTLPALAPYLPCCHTFLSLASPHCGYFYSENPLMSTGLWLLKKWNKSQCLTQLSLTDAPNMEETFLYQLSQRDQLWRFRNLFFVASQQDKYVPFHSARVENCRDSASDKNRARGAVYERMIASILGRVSTSTVLKRFDCQFVQRRQSLDSLIGRAMHIAFLDQRDYMQALAYIYRHCLAGSAE